jgi:hypothetical protein
MKLLDTPIRPLLSRTPRELVLITGGALACGLALYLEAPWALTTTFVVTTVMLATRFFAARIVAIGMLATALAAHISITRYGRGWLHDFRLGDHIPELTFIGLGLLLLCGRDLAARFDLQPSGTGWRINRWRDLPRLHWRLSSVLGISLGAMGHFLWAAQRNVPAADGVFARWAIYGVLVCLALLFAGQAIGFLVSSALGIAVLVEVLPQVGAAEDHLHRAQAMEPHSLFAGSPHAALPIAIAASLVVLTATPYAARLLWRSLAARS